MRLAAIPNILKVLADSFFRSLSEWHIVDLRVVSRYNGGGRGDRTPFQ